MLLCESGGWAKPYHHQSTNQSCQPKNLYELMKITHVNGQQIEYHSTSSSCTAQQLFVVSKICANLGSSLLKVQVCKGFLIHLSMLPWCHVSIRYNVLHKQHSTSA